VDLLFRYQIAHLKGLAGASTVHLFADDMIAYLTIKSNRDCNKLQNDFDKLSIWKQKWKMVLTSLLLQNSFILSRTYILTIIRNVQNIILSMRRRCVACIIASGRTYEVLNFEIEGICVSTIK
jgi:hypothetical protein